MSDQPTASSVQSTAAVSGASLKPQYAQRVVRVYGISETEITQLSTLNGMSSAYFSLASFFASVALSVYFNAIFYTELTPEAKIAKTYVLPISLGVCRVFLILALYQVFQRGRVWNTIRKESV